MATATLTPSTTSLDLYVPDVVDDITRREFGIGALALGAAVLTGCAGDSTDEGDAASSSPDFEFVGDDGVTVALDRVPTRIAAWMSNAATLAQFGVQVSGVWGPPELARGVDLGDAASFGDQFLVNIEAMAEAQPELVVGNVFNGDFSLPQEEEFDHVTAIAPLLRLEANGPIVDMIEQHERLAIALGVDADAPELVAARDEFNAARDDLRAAIEAKPGLKVLSLALMEDSVFVGYLDYAPLIDLAGLGMDIHDNVDNDDAWDNGLSWEYVPELEADLIIWDDRPRFLSPDALADHPIWKRLPAVEAGQLVGYAFDAPLSYQFMAQQYREIEAVVSVARTDLVG